jgi:hypothetical protein
MRSFFMRVALGSRRPPFSCEEHKTDIPQRTAQHSAPVRDTELLLYVKLANNTVHSCDVALWGNWQFQQHTVAHHSTNVTNMDHNSSSELLE